MKPVCYTGAYGTGTYFPLFLPPAPSRNWVLLAFLPFLAFPFPYHITCLSQARSDFQLSPASFPLLPALVAWQKQLVYRAASTTAPAGAFHALSSSKWVALKLCPPTLPTSSTPPQTAPLAFLPFPTSLLQLWELALGACRLEAVLWLPGWRGGREGEVPRCR